MSYRTISILELTCRPLNCLKNRDILYIEDLIEYSEDDLLKIKNLGKKSLKEIVVALSQFGLRLKIKNKIDNQGNDNLIKNIEWLNTSLQHSIGNMLASYVCYSPILDNSQSLKLKKYLREISTQCADLICEQFKNILEINNRS